MENKKKILEYYFENHLSVKEIAGELKISSPYITKVIKSDARYTEEKSYRKDISKQKRKIAQNKFIKEKRDRKKIEDNYKILQVQHNQAVTELSKTKHLSNENYRKWNYSAYKYNPSKKRYEFSDELGRSYDVPKYIKER